MKARPNKKAVRKQPKTRTLARKIASDKRFSRNTRHGAARVGGTTHLNREQFNARHSHCINVQMVYADVERSLSPHISYGLGVPHKVNGHEFVPDMKAVCDHPEDGMCGQNPTDGQLEWINNKLAGVKTEVVKDGVDGDHGTTIGVTVFRPETVSVAVQGPDPTSKIKFTFKLGGTNGSQL